MHILVHIKKYFLIYMYIICCSNKYICISCMIVREVRESLIYICKTCLINKVLHLSYDLQ